MVKFMVAVGFVLAVAGPVFATQGGEGENTGCNGVGNPNSPCVGQGGAGGAGGTGIGINKTTNNNFNTNTNTNRNTNNNTNIQGQKQGQGQAQGQKQKQAQKQNQGQDQKQSVTDSGNSAVSIEGDRIEEPRQAPAVFAPNLTSSPEACMGSISGGGSAAFQGVGFGLTIGSTWKNSDCERRAYALRIQAMPGLTDAQKGAVILALLAQNPDVEQAFVNAGVAIPGKTGPKASTQGSVQPVAAAPAEINHREPFQAVSALEAELSRIHGM